MFGSKNEHNCSPKEQTFYTKFNVSIIKTAGLIKVKEKLKSG